MAIAMVYTQQSLTPKLTPLDILSTVMSRKTVSVIVKVVVEALDLLECPVLEILDMTAET